MFPRLQHFDTRQRLAFHPFEEGAAGGRDIGEVVGDTGTVEVAEAAAELTAAGKLVTVAGGGDTVAALNRAGVTGRFTYVSTAGGAFLEWLEGKSLPGVEVLRAK